MTAPKDSKAAEPRRPRPCAICSKLSVEAFYPFCSKRCADVDLNRWLSESYTVPVVELEPEDFDELERSLEQGRQSPDGK